jgi:glycosyltransferase involved in cell wall biosynthesis
MMRILFFNEFTLIPGGTDEVIKLQIQGLKAAGYDVKIFSFYHEQLLRAPSSTQVKVLIKSLTGKLLLKEFQEAIDEYQPHVIHFHNYYHLFRTPIWSLVNSGGAKIILHLHNYYPFCLNSLMMKNNNSCSECLKKNNWKKGILNKCYQDSFASSLLFSLKRSRPSEWVNGLSKVTKLISPSVDTRRIYRSSGVPSQKIRIIPNPVKIQYTPAMGKAKHIAYLGSIRNEKGLEILIDAAQKNSHLRFRVAGDGPDVKSFISKISELNNVEYIGFVTGKRKKNLLTNARFLFVPSYCAETFGMVVLEAYSRGVPVLTTGTGALKEIVHDGKTGRITTPETAAQSVSDFWAELEVYRGDYRSNCLKFVNKFSIEKHISQLIKLYTTCSLN